MVEWCALMAVVGAVSFTAAYIGDVITNMKGE